MLLNLRNDTIHLKRLWTEQDIFSIVFGNTYTYNANGIRTSKTVGGIRHNYDLDGAKILRETWNNNTLIPLYDNEDSVCGIIYNDKPFYFQKNLQGDIIAIVDKNADTVAQYTYDAWGVCTITQDISDCNIATINPFRYRGYYYDEEIGLYYVSNRYYNPEIRRWLSCDPLVYQGEFDETAGILSTNIYSYCANNPINYYDLSGESLTGVLIGVLIGAILGAAAGWGYAKYFNIPKNKT